MITLEQIHTQIAAAIKQSGLTQTELARRLNMRQSNISHYVKGDKMPALDTLANLCALLDLDANDILCIHDLREPTAPKYHIGKIHNSGKIDMK